jgi:hypothetical protein
VSGAALLEVSDAAPDVAVQGVEYRRLLGYPKDHPLTDRAKELNDWARAWYREHGRPWLYARQADGLDVAGGRVIVEGTTFVSPRLAGALYEAGADSAALVAVSAGRECEEEARRLWEEEKPDEYFFLEIYGSAVVEALVAGAAFRLCEWADRRGLAVLPHYSPGYPDWDIAEQRKLLDLIGLERAAGLPRDLRVLETGMLQPKKSLLAVFGLTPHVERVQRLTSLVPCTNCSLPGCRYRRGPYKHPLRQLEAVHAAPEDDGVEWVAGQQPLTRDARYSVATDVLKRWAEQRLKLRVLADGTVEAQFRYDGTTCSNMGRPLAFDYRIRLSSREDGYAITDLRCAPAPGDTGYEFMCGYIEDADGLMASIEGEKPLLGHPLDAVLRWPRGRSPAGCYCAASSREHKWGLALEVLHFALAREGAPARES